jgi:hypothetical protein
MSVDSFTEVSEQSWFNRGCSSIFGVFLGIMAVIIAFPILFWNEGRAVERYNSLLEGSGIVISVSPSDIDPANEGKLLHLTDLATTDEILSDVEFDISAQALKLKRDVEMYQWREKQESEKKKKAGGGTTTETTYSYEKVWSSTLINSGSFERSSGHENPDRMLVRGQSFQADKVTFGPFILSRSQLDSINDFTTLPLDPATLKLPPSIQNRATIANSEIYVGNDPGSAQIGDLRIDFQVVKPTTISLVAKQINNTFEPYRTRAGGTIDLLEIGSHSAESMFETAQTENTILTWILRFVGFIVMFVGFNMIFRPLSIAFDLIPFLGNIVEAGIGFLAFTLAISLSLITISIAWIFYRPLLAIGLLALAGLIVFAIVRFTSGRSQREKAVPDVAY